jgi:multidrug resistance efflux pump
MQAQVELEKTVVEAGVDGVLAQFVLREGDFVTPLGRPAGILIPTEAGRVAVEAGFDQLAGQVLKVGMTAEITCVSKPYVIIPMVVTDIQEFIASGAVRPTDNLLELSRTGQPGTILTYLEPMYEGGLEGVLPGTNCIANAYTNNYDRLHSDEDLSAVQWVALHAVDTIGLVHAMILRIQALLLPIQTLVFSGSH